MTHGDKTKAKTVKSSKASGQQKSSSAGAESRKAGAEKSNGKVKTAGNVKAPEVRETGKIGETGKAREAGKASEAGKVREAGVKAVEKAASPKTGAEKGGRTAASETAEKPRARGGAAVTGSAPFNNPLLADAFTRAVKKYSNAFRKLTD